MSYAEEMNVKKADTGYEQMDRLLNFLSKPAVEYNLPQAKLWGTLIGNNSVMVVSGIFMIDIREINLGNIEPGYFNYFESKFTDLTYPVPPDELLRQVDQYQDYAAKGIFDLSDLLERLNVLAEDGKIRKCRTIFAQADKMKQGDLVVKFDRDGKFQHPKLPKPFLISERSRIKRALPGQRYRIQIVNEESDAYMVSLVEPYGQIKAGTLFSPRGFIPNPDEKEAINHLSLEIFPPDMIATSEDAALKDSEKRMDAVHVDSYTLRDLLKIYLMSTNKLEIMLPKNPNHPVKIRNLREPGSTEPEINITVATLDPSRVGQMR